METIIIAILLMWILGPHSKTYWGLAGILTLFCLFTFWPLGIATALIYLIAIPLAVPRAKQLIEARKKEP